MCMGGWGVCVGGWGVCVGGWGVCMGMCGGMCMIVCVCVRDKLQLLRGHIQQLLGGEPHLHLQMDWEGGRGEKGEEGEQTSQHTEVIILNTHI